MVHADIFNMKDLTTFFQARKSKDFCVHDAYPHSSLTSPIFLSCSWGYSSMITCIPGCATLIIHPFSHQAISPILLLLFITHVLMIPKSQPRIIFKLSQALTFLLNCRFASLVAYLHRQPQTSQTQHNKFVITVLVLLSIPFLGFKGRQQSWAPSHPVELSAMVKIFYLCTVQYYSPLLHMSSKHVKYVK